MLSQPSELSKVPLVLRALQNVLVWGRKREAATGKPPQVMFPVHISCCTGNPSATGDCFPLFLNIVLRSKDKRVGRNLGDLLVQSLHFTRA